jgi:uncharacterized protein
MSDRTSFSLVRRWARLLGGLGIFGFAIALMIRAEIGLGPWDAFHVGLHLLTGISVGGASILAGLAIVCCTVWIGVRPGPGTLANMVLVGVFLDLMLPLVPAAGGWIDGVGYFIAGVALCGVATGMYISAGLGEGPRDGLMVGMSRRTGWPVGRVRTVIELSVLGSGWLMGGQIGFGTVLFALTIGTSVQWGLRLFPHRSARVATVPT